MQKEKWLQTRDHLLMPFAICTAKKCVKRDQDQCSAVTRSTSDARTISRPNSNFDGEVKMNLHISLLYVARARVVTPT